MKKLLLATATTAVTASAGGAMAADLIYGSFLVSTDARNAIVMPALIDRVTAATGLSMDIAAGGSLSGPNETLATLQSGAIDAAMMIYVYTPTELPVLTFVGNLYSTDNMVAAPALLETIMLGCESCSVEQEEEGIKIVMHSASPNYAFLCNKPIIEPTDLRGLNIRATGSMGPLVASLGAIPVNVAYAEVYEALQRGVLDCTVGTLTELRTSQLWEVVTDMTYAPIGTYNPFGTLVFNRDVWENFSPEEKRAWYDSSALGLAHDLTDTLKNVNESAAGAIESHGVILNEASPALLDAVTDFRANESQQLIDAAIANGVTDAQEIYDYFQEALARWEAIVAGIGDPYAGWNEEQIAQYAAAIKENVYDKLSVE